MQAERRARVNIIPIHVERSSHGIHVAVLLIVLLVVEGLQFHRALVNPLSALRGRGRRIELRVERQHMQVHLLVAYHVDGLAHILDKHAVGRPGAVDADDHIGLFQSLLLLLLTRRAALLQLLLILVDGIVSHPVCRDDGSQQQLIEPRGKRLSAGRVADDVDAVVQSALLLGPMIEEVPRPCGQRAHKRRSGEHRSRIRLPVQSRAYLPQTRIVVKHRLYLRAPFSQRHLSISHNGDSPFCEILGVTQFGEGFLEFFRLLTPVLQFTGPFHRGLHGITLTDQIHHPRLCLQCLQHLLRRIVAHIPQQVCQIPHLVVPVTLSWHHTTQQLLDNRRHRNAMIAHLLHGAAFPS